MINIQVMEKRRDNDDGRFLDVHSVFYTIQGEGPFCGHPAVFVRLAGCNLQCPSCDTEYTQGRKMMDIEGLAALVMASFPSMVKHRLVVITGGEPFRQNITPFMKLFADMKGYLEYIVQIETNGTLPPSPGWSDHDDVVVICSPKTGKIHPSLAKHIDAYKYVLSADSVRQEDGLPLLALNHTAKPYVARPHEGFNGPVYVQPMDPKDPTQYVRNVQAVKESCMKHGYMLQLQVHKIINVE